MTRDQITELETTLLKFVTDTVKNATSEEAAEAVRALPEVARVLVELERFNRS